MDLYGSMRHQEAKRRRLKQTVGHSSKYPFSDPAMTIGACYNEIGAIFLCQTNELTGIGFGRMDANISLAFPPMALQKFCDIADPTTCLILCIRCANLYDGDRRTVRKGTASRTARRASRVSLQPTRIRSARSSDTCSGTKSVGRPIRRAALAELIER
jgi:hypothetical protein